MNKYVLAASVLVFLAGARAFAGTGQVTVQCNVAGFVPCSDGSGDFSFTNTTSTDCTTSDQLPSGARVIAATVNIWATEYLNAPSTMTVSLNGATIGSQSVDNPDAQCNRTGWANYTFSNTFPNGVPNYHAGGSNTVHLAGTGMFSFQIFTVTMNVTYDLPPVFDISSSTPEMQRRVLISKQNTGDFYDSMYQRQDRQITISATFYTDSGATQPPGTPVFFRLIDPAGTARWMPAGQKYIGDNIPDGASISPTSSSTDSAGKAQTTLTITNQFAGNNYQIEATTDPAMASDPNYKCQAACAASGVVTAWKRVYIEKARMFRAGAFVVGTAPAGQNQVTVSAASSFAAGQQVRLVHAPPLDGSGTRSFYFEDQTIQSVNRDPSNRTNRILVLTANLTHAYTADNSVAGVTIAHDGVGILSSSYYDRNNSYMAQPFNDAFVELQDAAVAVSEIPYVGTVGDYQALADKWFENSQANGRYRPGNPNVKHVLGGSTCGVDDIGDTGITGAGAPSPNYSWTWAGQIENDVSTHNNPLYGLSAWTVNGENAVHEFAHGWGVNANYSGGHCNANMALNSGLYCTLNVLLANGQVQPADAAQLNDGVVGFHWLSTSDSEYESIRRRIDPVPQP